MNDTNITWVTSGGYYNTCTNYRVKYHYVESLEEELRIKETYFDRDGKQSTHRYKVEYSNREHPFQTLEEAKRYAILLLSAKLRQLTRTLTT